MNGQRYFLAALIGILLGMGAVATAEITVSVTISGKLEEVIPLLEQLRQIAPTSGAQASETGLQLQVHSVATEAAPAAPATAQPLPPVEPPKPTLGIHQALVRPETAKAGDTVLVSVVVTDPDRKVDTIGAAAPDLGNLAFDLYDNGSSGDSQPGDGIWSYSLLIPAGAAPGEHVLTITAYDANGAPVTVPGEDGAPHPLQVQARVTVAP